MQTGKPLLIVRGRRGEALATLVVNKIRGTFTSVAVKAPGFGERRKRCSRTWPSSRAPGHLRGDRPQARLGHHRPAGQRPPGHRDEGQHDHRRGCRLRGRREGRIAQIKREIDDTDSDWDREKLQERLAKLAGAWPWSRSAPHRGGAQGEEAPYRGRAVRHPGRRRGGHRGRGGTALVRSRAAVQAVIDSLEGDEAPAPPSC